MISVVWVSKVSREQEDPFIALFEQIIAMPPVSDDRVVSAFHEPFHAYQGAFTADHANFNIAHFDTSHPFFMIGLGYSREKLLDSRAAFEDMKGPVGADRHVRNVITGRNPFGVARQEGVVIAIK